MEERDFGRRSFIKSASAVTVSATTAAAGCLGGEGGDGGDGADGEGDGSAEGDGGDAEPAALEVTTPEGNLNIMHFLHGTDEGYWEQRNIDLTARVTSFGEWANALVSGDQDVGTLELNSMATLVDEGEDLVHFGPNLTQINSIFTTPDSDIESVEDLQGATLGLPTWASGTATYIQAMIYDQFGFDIREETDHVTADPASLWNLMTEQNEFDAMIQFTGFTVRGLASPDQVQSIFNAWEFWEEQTGYPALITPWTAKRSWLEENWDLAYRNLQAWSDVQSSFEENTEAVVEQYGRLAGLGDEDIRQTVVDIASDGSLNYPVEEFDEDLVDSQWQLLEAMAELGSIPAVPPKDEHIYTIDEVAENAGVE